MQIYACDICGAALDHDEPNTFEPCPNGFFNLDFHRPVTDEGKPCGWHYEPFHMCPQCRVMVNQAVFEKIEKIQETQFHPTAIVPIRKFPPEPIEIKNGFPVNGFSCSTNYD